MQTYSVETEGELLSGCIDQEIRRLGKETSEIALILQDLRNTLVSSFRRKFADEIKDVSDADAHLKQASAWCVSLVYLNGNFVCNKFSL